MTFSGFTALSPMQMLLTRPHEIHSRAAIIQPNGSLNAESAVQFQALLKAAVLSNQHSSLVVDMQQVEHMDSAGLMALVNGLRLAQHTNKRFCLCSVSRSVRIILELTQLDKVLEIFETPLAADLAAC